MIKGTQTTVSTTNFSFTQKQITEGICEDLEKQGFKVKTKQWNEANTKLLIEATAVPKGGR